MSGMSDLPIAKENGGNAPDDVDLIDELEWADPTNKFSSNELAIRPRPQYPDPCGCVDAERCCCDESCVLFACQEECHECLDQCQNQRITKKQWKNVEVFDAGLKGKGLRAREPIKKGEFILEYVGKAVRKEYLERLFSRYKQDRMLYIMALDSNVFIDARQRGGKARYINHSCSPNCIVERWKVRGQLRAGVFALTDIDEGQELSFDYQWERRRGRAATKCYCGSPACRGTIELPKSLEEEEFERQLSAHWLKPPTQNMEHEIINRSIRIYSDNHGDYFAADVCRYDAESKKHLVMYRDTLEEVWEDLSRENWQLLDEEAEQFVITKKKKQQQGVSLLTEPSSPFKTRPTNVASINNTFTVGNDLKNLLEAKGFIANVGRRFTCSIDLERCSDQETVNWKLTISGASLEKACSFLEKNIVKLQQYKSQDGRPSGMVSVPPTDQMTEHVIIPRCAVDSVKKRLPAFREKCRSVNLQFAPSESKSKQFAKLQIEASLLSDMKTAKEHLWGLLQKACEEVSAPISPSGIYRDLVFFGGELKSDRFQMLLNKPRGVGEDKMRVFSHDATQELRRYSSFFASFESTQRCTVWVQAEDDMGRIDANRIVNEFHPSSPRKIYFGCDPIEVPKLWALVEQRANELARGIRYFHLGADRMYQQLMMKNGGKFFQYIEQITGAKVNVDPMTGDHLRIDGGLKCFSVGLGMNESVFTPNDIACLVEEIVRLQIELYRDQFVRQHSWLYGRDWSLTAGALDSMSKVDCLSPAKSGRAMVAKFEMRNVSISCLEIAEITNQAGLDSSIGGHAAVILYRFLKVVGDDESYSPSFKIRDMVVACLFLANKSQKVTKYMKLDDLLEAAYSVFFPGSKFSASDQEAINFSQKVVLAESEILKALDYDVFWKGGEWICRAIQDAGHISRSLAQKTLDLAVSGPVLAAGADLWLKYGIEYIFVGVAGFLAANIEPMFEILSLIPLKVSQAAELIAEAIKIHGSSRKSTRSLFSGGNESFLSNLAKIKQTCIQSMTKMREDQDLKLAGESNLRYKLIGQRDNHRLIFKDVSTTVLNEAIIPIIDAICAESKSRVFVAESSVEGCEDIVLEGSWRALAIAEFLLVAACEVKGGRLPIAVDSLGEGASLRLQSKTSSGLLTMADISTLEGWEGTIQSRVGASFGRKVGGKASVAGRIKESDLRDAGLRWWIPPKFAPSPTGSIFEMHCVRRPATNNDDLKSHLGELSALGLALVGSEELYKNFPHMASLIQDRKLDDRFVAVSMQRWPPEKIQCKEGPSTGFSPIALQEMQLLTQLHSLIPSPSGHPNIVLPVALAMPYETDDNSPDASAKEFGMDDIFSLFRSSEENERRAIKEKKRQESASGPHLVFHPTPFLFSRVLRQSTKMRRDDQCISNTLLSAWFHDLLSALVHCHTNHVIFRSTQPDQILIDHSGVAKLAGFYRATVLEPDERNRYLNPVDYVKSRKDKKEDGDDAPSPYTAPELLLGSVKQTKETDIWAVGSMMAHLLLGKQLFVGKERTELLMAMYKIIGTPCEGNFPDADRKKKLFPYVINLDKEFEKKGRDTDKKKAKYKRNVEKAFQYMMKDEDYAKHEKAVDLIAKMLHLDPKQRISAVDALRHDFVQNYVESCNSKDFRDNFVDDWMTMKKNLIHSDKDDEDDALKREKSLKRKAMLEAAKAYPPEEEEDDDLYDIDDLLGDAKKQRVNDKK